MIRSGGYTIENLGNGLLRVFCLKSRLAGLYLLDGSYRSGDLRLSRSFIETLLENK